MYQENNIILYTVLWAFDYGAFATLGGAAPPVQTQIFRFYFLKLVPHLVTYILQDASEINSVVRLDKRLKFCLIII
jgi:hypothetical protein